MPTIVPLADKIVVKPFEKEASVSAGGIYIPTVKKHAKGKVVAVGAGKALEGGHLLPSELEAGDVVYFNWTGANVIEFYGEELILIKESDILAVVKE